MRPCIRVASSTEQLVGRRVRVRVRSMRAWSPVDGIATTQPPLALFYLFGKPVLILAHGVRRALRTHAEGSRASRRSCPRPPLEGCVRGRVPLLLGPCAKLSGSFRCSFCRCSPVGPHCRLLLSAAARIPVPSRAHRNVALAGGASPAALAAACARLRAVRARDARVRRRGAQPHACVCTLRHQPEAHISTIV